MNKKDWDIVDKIILEHIPDKYVKRFRVPKKELKLKEYALYREKLRVAFENSNEFFIFADVSSCCLGTNNYNYEEALDISIEQEQAKYYKNELLLHFYVYAGIKKYWKKYFTNKIKTLNNFEKCNICHGSGKCVDCTAKSDETLKECIRYKENICCSCYGTGLNKLYYQKEHCKELGINEYYTSLVCI